MDSFLLLVLQVFCVFSTKGEYKILYLKENNELNIYIFSRVELRSEGFLDSSLRRRRGGRGFEPRQRRKSEIGTQKW